MDHATKLDTRLSGTPEIKQHRPEVEVRRPGRWVGGDGSAELDINAKRTTLLWKPSSPL
jgi:hypothetical protein